MASKFTVDDGILGALKSILLLMEGTYTDGIFGVDIEGILTFEIST